MKKSEKKLRFSKVTLSNLDAVMMNQVHGGIGGTTFGTHGICSVPCQSAPFKCGK